MTYKDVLNKYKKNDGAKNMLTPLVEENKILLIHGESGAGKTVYAIKHLNENGIIPLLLDLDDNEAEELESLGCKCDMVDGYAMIEAMEDEDVDALKGKVVIIDTWTLFWSEIGDETLAHQVLKNMCAKGVTVIVAAHTTPYSGKEDKPQMLDEIYRHIKGRLYVRKTTLKNMVEYHLLVEKVRGYKGTKIELIRSDSAEVPDKKKK